MAAFEGNCSNVHQLSTEQLASYYFSLTKAIESEGKKATKVQVELKTVEKNIEKSVQALQEIKTVRKRLEQKEELLEDKLTTLQEENNKL